MYGTIHDSIFESSLLVGRGPDEIFTAYVFMGLITIADASDDVLDRREVLCAKLNVSRETLDRAISELEAPDPRSSSPEQEGRRITRLHDNRDWGWHIVNRNRYKRLRTIEDRKDYQHQKYEERKSKSPKDSTPVNNPQHPSTISTQAVGSRQEEEGKRKRERRAREALPNPTLPEAIAYAKEHCPSVDGERWWHYQEARGWRTKAGPIVNWQSAMRTWVNNGYDTQNGNGNGHGPPKEQAPPPNYTALEKAKRDREAWEKENAK